MEKSKYLEDISEIKNIMNRSSRFISLSGMSGILAGMFALVGAYLAYMIVYESPNPNVIGTDIILSTEQIFDLTILGISVMILALISGVLLSMRKAKKNGEKIWDTSSQRLIINFLIPLSTGAIVCLIMIQKGLIIYVAPLTLLFYGLSCVHASKYTIGGVRYLGITIILIGLIATYFTGYGLLFWAIGFGLCHIIYGALMYFKYEG
ncbi:MAG: hypothetical protein IPO45_01195 [Saprospiraceae bacterium]|jgi:hypothetical protein|uniref:hypothetical protein n=1 Tax=Candidatus Brachybacter algidus TaxID=2982024 RepID=UPI001B63235A|nr:hypothetical protein [Candidatus Brachybacter algidus]MBP7305696.1 hypothetical protein [Saprospiraceae bacterium]MBK6373471.1 hypothetical protein [Candidatus Brachybacter algidus]MBK6449500.1 hypothetical protein [Candidatus Brachybacter algidus]MBK7604609.1 hypothetical protein [Candidatus Brachybacter algidus]MBK8355215.1 hypothetical protein [Candidatus Brachybacter algidus]